MVTMTSAENALKTLYLGVLADQLNVGVNPLYAKIAQTGADVWGKEIRKLAPYGVNGGVGAGTESGNLPSAGGNNYAQFTLTLKNLFGQIELSDKAIRASENSAGAFVNLLNAEMDGLLKASKFNLSRMLYGNGGGQLATLSENTTANATNDYLKVSSVKNLVEGMTVDVYNNLGSLNSTLAGSRILSIDRANKIVRISKTNTTKLTSGSLYCQNSKNNELTGLEALFASGGTLYGLSRSDYAFLNPYVGSVTGGVTSTAVQSAIDSIEENVGSSVNFIVGSYDVRRSFIDYLTINRTNLDYMTLDGGYNTLSYSGIPFVADRFVADKTMYLLNTDDFKMHQLCDWRWLEGEGGTVLHQTAGKPVYTATLVKYADLLCERPMGQAKVTFSDTGMSYLTTVVSMMPVYYTVTYNSDGGSAVSAENVICGGKASTPTAPTKTNKTFSKWVYENDTTTEFNFNTPITENVALKALWT